MSAYSSLRTIVPATLILTVIAGCEQPEAGPSEQGRPAALSIAGELQKKALDEASGMTLSARDPGILWLHNDSGDKARLYAADLSGRHLGRLKLDKADNRDWEDIASFVLDDTPYLLVADIGDNDARHEHATLYVVEEPDLEDGDEQESEAAWRIRFRYPDGPRDAEAVAVDAANDRVLVLTKRDIPPVLYSVPLRPETGGIVEAQRLGEIVSLPPPTRQDLEFAPQTKDWHWQTTAMDIAPDGSAAVVMTYAAVYYYPFDGDWLSSLNQVALGFGLRRIRDAESVAFGADSNTIFLTVERKKAPLFRIDMGKAEK
jgi:hypothetical protein